MTQVLISFGNFTTNLNFWIPTGSVATYLRCGGEMIYWKFPFLSSGEKFWKSDEIWRSYGTFLEHSVYTHKVALLCVQKTSRNVNVAQM